MGDQNSVPPVTLPLRTVMIYITDRVLNAGSYQITIKYNQNPVGLGYYILCTLQWVVHG